VGVGGGGGGVGVIPLTPVEATASSLILSSLIFLPPKSCSSFFSGL